MANGNDDSMMMIFMMMLLAGGGVALYMMMKKRSPSAQIDVLNAGPGGVTVVSPPASIRYTPHALDPNNPVFPLGIYEKFTVPITGGSEYGESIWHFADYAKGTCQCDEWKCCYKGEYQPRRGGTRTEKECADIYYGDPVDACERATMKFNREVFRVSTKPSSRRAVSTGLASRISRMFH